MSRSYWHYYTAFGLAVLVMYGLPLVRPYVASWIAGQGIFACDYAKTYSDDGSPKEQQGYSLGLRTVSDVEEPNHKGRQSDIHDDLHQQWRMADAAVEANCYAGWQTAIAIWALLGVVGTVYFAWSAAHWAREAAKAGAAAVRNERAWMTRGKISIAGSPDDRVLEISWVNTGRSPALNVRGGSAVRLIGDDESIPDFERDPGDTNSGILGQGEKTITTRPISKSDWDRFTVGSGRLILYSSVIYRDVFGSESRYTEICGRLMIGDTIASDGQEVVILKFSPIGLQNTAS